jgi:DNA replication protein DnaC
VTDLDALLMRLHLPTVRRLYAELETRAESAGMSYRDYLAALFAEEVAHRAQTRIERSVRRARFPFLKTIDEFDFTFQTSIRLAQLGSFLGPELVSEGRCAIFYGSTGTGKTHLSVAIAYKAIQNGFEARFAGANELIERLSLANEQGRLRETLDEYVHPHVLVIDEVGYLVHRPDAANVLFHVVNERHLRKRPIIVTTNKPDASWGRVLHDSDLAEAILDRLLERGRRIDLVGPSYRTRHLEADPRSRRRSLLDDNSPSDAGRREPARIPGMDRTEFAEPTSSLSPSSRSTRHPARSVARSLAASCRASSREARSDRVSKRGWRSSRGATG